MLEDIRTRVTRLFASNGAQSRNHSNAPRQDRHSLILSLQADVRRLQQEISDLTDIESGNDSGVMAEVDSEQMAALHRKLNEKQVELARYQGRI